MFYPSRDFVKALNTPGTYTALIIARAQLGCTAQDTVVVKVVADTTQLLINRAGVSYLNANADWEVASAK